MGNNGSRSEIQNTKILSGATTSHIFRGKTFDTFAPTRLTNKTPFKTI